LARQAAARRVARAVLSVQLSGRPHSEAWSVPPAAAVAPSCFRRAEEAQRPAALSGPAWWRVPAAASHQPAGAVVESSVRPAASVPQVRLPAEEAAVVWGAKVQPQEAAEVLPGPSAQQPVAAEEARVVSAAEAQPREAAEAASDAEEARQPVAAAGALDAVAEPQQAVVAAEPDAVAAQLPGVAAEGLPDGEVPQQEAGHPSAPLSWRPGGPRPWLARRQVERSAHAMRSSRVVSPSRQSWRAAGCEGLS
jgi:hypothetical protein